MAQIHSIYMHQYKRSLDEGDLDQSISNSGSNGVGVGDHREQGAMLRFLDGLQRVHVSLQGAQGLRPPQRGLPRVPPPRQRGKSPNPRSIYFDRTPDDLLCCL